MNKKIVSWLDRTFYRNIENRWDDRYLREVILEYLKPEFTVLDIGAGRGRIKEMDFKALSHRVYGVDPDKRVVENPLLHEGFEGLGDNMPFFQDAQFDMIFSDNVFEHVEHPEKLFNEVNRVLKPKGLFINKTPNKFHYMPLVASITPTSFHKFINRLRGRDESDTFPTFYRANSRSAQKRHATLAGFKVERFIIVESRPEYMRMTFLTYPFGIIYERLVNLLRIHSMKAVLISVMTKKP